MAWGSGSFTPGVYDKEVPGFYFNIKVTPPKHSVLLERGYVAVPMMLPWGADEQVMEVTAEDYYKNGKKFFGFNPGTEQMKLLDELFLNAQVAYIYRLNSGDKAQGQYGEAACSGALGNKIEVVIEEDPDNPNLHYNITTTLGTETKNQSLPEDLQSTTVEFTATDDTIKATYKGVPRGYTLQAKLKMKNNGVLVAVMPGRIDEVTTSDSVSYTFWPEAPATQYIFEAGVKKTEGSKYTEISKREFTLGIEQI